MTVAQVGSRTPLRLWPGVVAVVLQWLIRFVLPVVVPGTLIYSVMGGLLVGLLVLFWWLFLSRAPWLERLGAIFLMFAALFATSRLTHESIANGAQGMLLLLLAPPVLTLAFVVWAVATRRLPDKIRRATMVATILLACGVWTLVRTGGLTGDFENDLHWRWAKSPEERLVAQAGELPAAPVPPAAAEPMPAKLPPAPPSPASQTPAEWPGFRGPARDGVAAGARIATDWSLSPPVKLWRRPVGPAWSSFAVQGDFIYTLEQRGPNEAVTCYRLTTGEPVWAHRDRARFWESNAGAGPRSTPTLANGRVYTFGATGILNALNAADGAVVWSRNAASDTGTKIPGWGFASSPLLVDDVVIVAAEGRLAAYDRATGAPRWTGPAARGAGYSSPHLLTIDGVQQVLLMSGAGAISVAPADGAPLWENAWKSDGAIVQPAFLNARTIWHRS